MISKLIAEETNTTINENSIAFEQFIKLADADKKRRLKKLY